MIYDTSAQMNPAFILPPAVYIADNTPVSVDLSSGIAATLILQVGIGGITFTGSNKIEFVLTHSDDDVTYANVATADLVGVTGVTGGIVRSLIAAHAAPSLTKIGYIGRKRYLKLLADFNGTHGTGTPLSALIISEKVLRIAPT